MDKTLNKIKNSKGYVSIETLIVSGLIIGFGAFFITKFITSGKKVGNNAISSVDKANSDVSAVKYETPSESH